MYHGQCFLQPTDAELSLNSPSIYGSDLFCSFKYYIQSYYVIQCVDFTRNSILFQVHYSTIRNHTQATITAIPMVFFMPMQTVCGSLRVGLSDKLSYVPPLQNWCHGATGTDQNNFAVSNVVMFSVTSVVDFCGRESTGSRSQEKNQ